MNTNSPYAEFSLCREMMETVELVRQFRPDELATHAPTAPRLLMTGEGSSRILPAKHARVTALRAGWPVYIEIEGADQAREYQLDGLQTFIASNSGRTAEAIRLARQHDGRGMTAVVATPGGELGQLCEHEILLGCGPEQAVAATKSVVEQALVYQALLYAAQGVSMPSLDALADAIHHALTMDLDREMVDRVARAPVIHFAGRNDGVAEELTLKTNEITRRRSTFLEGTYAVHGIEEVMSSDDVVIVVDPFPEEDAAFDTALRRGVGLDVVAIASRTTPFDTISIPDAGVLNGFVQLAAGWNLLVEVGLQLGVNLDKPERARKVGNAYAG